jgi:hypothetical protein
MKKIISLLVLTFFWPLASQAATIYFSPEQGAYQADDVFALDVKLDLANSDECINTIEAIVGFDNEYLELVDFGSGDSILSLWLEKPDKNDLADINHNKRLKFTGGVPGGYCGRIPGDAGNSNNLAKLIFKIIKPAPDSPTETRVKAFFYPETLALLNDGLGTEADLVSRSAELLIRSGQGGSRQEWDKLKMSDNIEPEVFDLELLRDPNLYEGKYYLVWNTTDKQTGLDHYEIQESRQTWADDKQVGFFERFYLMFNQASGNDQWQSAESPYILKDQKLASHIRVKAVDKAGNARVVEYFPANEQTELKSKVVLPAVSVLLLSVVILAILVVRKRRKIKLENK